MIDLDIFINKEIKNINDNLKVFSALRNINGSDKKFINDVIKDYYNDLECLYTLRFIYHNYKTSLKCVDI